MWCFGIAIAITGCVDLLAEVVVVVTNIADVIAAEATIIIVRGLDFDYAFVVAVVGR